MADPAKLTDAQRRALEAIRDGLDIRATYFMSSWYAYAQPLPFRAATLECLARAEYIAGEPDRPVSLTPAGHAALQEERSR